jgi:putative ATP-dependent endonuclease of OLD family
MRLASLAIRHFRGVAEARLELDPAITLIVGENDFGKTSLLEALFMALGGGEPELPIVFGAPHLFHVGRTPDTPIAGPPAIELSFVEKHDGEEGPGSPLAGVLGPSRGAPRGLRLTIEGHLEDAGIATTFTIAGTAEGARAVTDDRALLAALRRMHPLLWLRGGMLVGTDLLAGPVTGGGASAHAILAPEIEALARDLEGRYRRVVTGQSLHTARDISAGAAAAESLLKLREETEQESVSSIAEGPVFAEIVGRRTLPSRQAVQRRRSRMGSAAQRIGVLMLVAAVMRSGRGAFAPDVDPIVAIEDPEAHLHPMTLATIWDLLQQIGWQKVVTTHSGTLLSSASLGSLRRLVRSQDGALVVRSVRPEALGRDVLRKFSYHVRLRRGAAMFARAWLLVEGETEFWILTELARLVGFDLQQEGVAVVEFAQSGLAPLVKVADALGIGWHLLADGDRAGQTYATKARALCGDRDPDAHVTLLRDRDVEHCFFEHGHRAVFVQAAGLTPELARALTTTRIIQKALRAQSKPGMAFALLEAAGREGGPGIPRPLRQVVERVLALAWGHSPSRNPP